MTLFSWISKREMMTPPTPQKAANPITVKAASPVVSLLDISAGGSAWVQGFSEKISPQRQAQLQAYGLIPGRKVRVAQHNPVTVLQVEHTELALEGDLARGILVVKEQ